MISKVPNAEIQLQATTADHACSDPLSDESICKEINNHNFRIISLFLKQKCMSIAPWENNWIYSSNKSSILNKQLSRVQLYAITTSFHIKNRSLLLSILSLKPYTSYQQILRSKSECSKMILLESSRGLKSYPRYRVKIARICLIDS